MGSQKPLCCLTSSANCYYSQRFFYFPKPISYHISLTYLQGLKPIILELLAKGLLHPTHSPYNTPILPVKKPSGSYRLVQDLCLINAMMTPIHPVVPNPSTLLSLFPDTTTHFTVLHLKDAFFVIPVHPQSQNLFAFTWTDPDSHISQQLTWTTLPQGFQDSPHLLAKLWLGTSLPSISPRVNSSSM
jgi:hypothetical protein